MYVENHVKKYRRKFNFTQTDLAGILECSQNTISDIENYKHEPSLLLALKMCIVFKCEINDLFVLTGCGYAYFLTCAN